MSKVMKLAFARSRPAGVLGRLICLLLCLSASAFAHEGEPHDLHELASAWSFDPLVIAALLVSAFLYIRGCARLWRSAGGAAGLRSRDVAAFAGGWLFLLIALVSPVHAWGEVLFSAHMTQHEILMLISAPLFVLGRPMIATMWALPKPWRSEVRSVFKAKPVQSVWGFISNPFAAWTIHAIALWTWHIPALFQATLESDLIHTLQHLSFFLSALLFWWAIIAGPRGVMSYGAGVLYLFTTSLHSGVLGAFLTFTGAVIYPIYEQTTGTWGLTPLEDQQLGGLIMWVPAGLVYIVAGLIMFAGWLRESERRMMLRQRSLLAAANTEMEVKL